MAFDQLFTIDLGTREAQFIAQDGFYAGSPIAVEGLAYAPDGTLFAASDNAKILLTLEQSGTSHVRGTLGVSGGQGQFNSLDTSLAMTCDGRAWLASAVIGKFWNLDPASGAATEIGDLGAQITGLAARGNELFGAGGRGDDGLYRIDRATGHATLIGPFGAGIANSNVAALAFDRSGTLWAAVNYFPPMQWASLAKVDPRTGAATIVGDITGPTDKLAFIPIRGMAIASPCEIAGGPPPVPTSAPTLSPWSLALLAFAMVVAGTLARRRRPIS